jgi:hypothetical protein
MNRETSPDCARRECIGRPTMARPIRLTIEDEREFQVAMDQYKLRSGRQFPTWSEILEVLRSLGYAKRIWRPVGAWSPMPPSSIGGGPGGAERGGIVGWFATTETTVMP